MFVVALYDCFDGVLKLKGYYTDTAEDALLQALGTTRDELPEEVECTVESLKAYAEDMDTPVNVLEVL